MQAGKLQSSNWLLAQEIPSCNSDLPTHAIDAQNLLAEMERCAGGRLRAWRCHIRSGPGRLVRSRRLAHSLPLTYCERSVV